MIVKDMAGRKHSFQCWGVILFILLNSACTPPQLPPINSETNGESHHGQIIWHDLITDDVEAAKEFYGNLLGWDFQQKGEYTLITNDTRPIGGMVQLRDSSREKKSAGWVSYFSVADVDETARWIQSMGGDVLKGPGDMVNRGRYALILDPLGAPVMLLHSINGDPPALEARRGDWLWNELWTTDVDAALSFYQSLGDFAAQRLSPENKSEYWVLLDENEHHQGGITGMPFEKLPPQWVPVIRVEDSGKLAQHASALGGEVIIHPDHSMGDGSVALIKDPAGGIFMVEVWESVNKAQQ